MAQTTVPVYLSGKLGSMVYTGNRQGTAVRMLVTPKNPETAGQTAQRQRFSAAAKTWSALVSASQPPALRQRQQAGRSPNASRGRTRSLAQYARFLGIALPKGKGASH
jgi:hypothetical protein